MERVVGVVVSWDEEEGWGTLESEFARSEVFAHFSNLEMEGYHVLQPGQLVEFLLEEVPGGQDGYTYRAEQVRVVGP